jgi:hypothetical protein
MYLFMYLFIYLCMNLFIYVYYKSISPFVCNKLNLNSVNQLIFVIVKSCVFFEVRTEFLNNI